MALAGTPMHLHAQGHGHVQAQLRLQRFFGERREKEGGWAHPEDEAGVGPLPVGQEDHQVVREGPLAARDYHGCGQGDHGLLAERIGPGGGCSLGGERYTRARERAQ